VPVSFCSLCFVFESRILLLGVQSFSSRVFSALGMPPTWQPWIPHRDQGHEPATGREPKRKKAATDDMVQDEAGPGKHPEAHSSAPALGGAVAPYSGMPVDPLAPAAALTVGRPSPILQNPLAAGDCRRCKTALMRFDMGWNTQLCNRCFNVQQGYDKCKKCRTGLWACERKAGLGLCRGCHTYACRHCEVEVGVDELRYGRRLCNRCYNVWMCFTDRCLSCRRGLLLPEQEANTGWCDPCWQEWRPEGGR